MTDKIQSVADYLKQLPAERQSVIQELRRVIQANLPQEFEERYQYQMISYVVPRDLYPPGYHCQPEDELSFLSLASQKQHIAIYHNGIYMFDQVREWFLTEYPKYMTTKPDIGKSCIRFRNMKTIPYELIGQLCQKVTLQEFIDQYEARNTNK
ncbi:DUF1801 domain-containing protein [Vaginisenegalia massiliensis]|uniref:DUF1801 domain-containing protein n=1 Tax=Vaginisenegalia massiliensis TaxID=2058294 RepID=UPI000F5417D2|nr:DUF1801 domain-containing protein [Vaginisenegalia massiliensis]